MILIGQSLELSRPRLLAALRARDPEPIRDRLRRQVEAGAAALDLNGGVHADAADFAWCAVLAAERHPGARLLIDTVSPLLIAEALDAGRRAGVASPLLANSLAVDAHGTFDADAAAGLRAAVRHDAGVVLSPRLVDSPAAGRPAPATDIALAGLRAAEQARAHGVTGPLYLDALAFPPRSDPARCARSLEVLRAWRDTGGGEPLTAVGNVGYGADAPLAAAMRAVYAAAAVGAGARALILPVEESRTVRAARIAAGEVAPASDEEAWLLDVAAAARTGGRPGRAPEHYQQAARLVLGAARP